MADRAYIQTDKELARLEKRIHQVYGDAREDIQDKITEYFDRFVERDKHQKALLEAGKIDEAQYKQWRLNQFARGERYIALRDQLAERMTKANETAVAYTNDITPGIYSLNRNYAAYTIEQASGDVGFTLWDEQTVKRLIVEQPELMPYYPPGRAVKRGIDLEYGRKKITACITTGVLQGESIGKIANRLQDSIVDMNRTSALRTARTAVTGAQNAGRLDTYYAAQKKGITLQKEWLATLDGRTRDSHRWLDGKKADIDKRFPNGCRYPGDPQGPASEVYNCRCTLVSDIAGVEAEPIERRARDPVTGKNELISDMTYLEWYEWKRSQNPVEFDAAIKKRRNEASDRKQFEKYQKQLGKNAPKTFAAFQTMKYNSGEWDSYKAYARSLRSGELTPLASFKLYQKTNNRIDDQLLLLKTSDGLEITGKSNHFVARVIGSVEQRRNGVELDLIQEALMQPTKVTHFENSWKYELAGKCSVTVNPQTGKLIQVNPLHTKEYDK